MSEETCGLAFSMGGRALVIIHSRQNISASTCYFIIDSNSQMQHIPNSKNLMSSMKCYRSCLMFLYDKKITKCEYKMNKKRRFFAVLFFNHHFNDLHHFHRN